MKRYMREGFSEKLRQLGRMIDFVTLLIVQSRRRRIPRLTTLRKAAFIELGPGPTRLAFLKRRLFAQVYFLDQDDFGKSDRGLTICDLEDCDSAQRILSRLRHVEEAAPVFFFADHCVEHLSTDVVLNLLDSIGSAGYSACFRVPNILSDAGLRNFERDVTHRSAFDENLRNKIRAMGFEIVPWIRWYRFQSSFGSTQTKMNKAEEIAICCTGDL